MQTQWIRIYLLHNQKPKIDLGRTIDKNSADRLVKPAPEFTKSVTKTISKVQKPKTYDRIINDLVHENKWQKAINKELWNQDLHQTWTYTFLSIGQKAIGCNWIFKVKYHLDGLIERYKTRLVAQRFSQVHGINYTKTFIPIVRCKLLKIFLAIADKCQR